MCGGGLSGKDGRGWGGLCYEPPLFAHRNDLLSVELLPAPYVCLNIIIACIGCKLFKASQFYRFDHCINSAHQHSPPSLHYLANCFTTLKSCFCWKDWFAKYEQKLVFDPLDTFEHFVPSRFRKGVRMVGNSGFGARLPLCHWLRCALPDFAPVAAIPTLLLPCGPSELYHSDDTSHNAVLAGSMSSRDIWHQIFTLASGVSRTHHCIVIRENQEKEL